MRHMLIKNMDEFRQLSNDLIEAGKKFEDAHKKLREWDPVINDEALPQKIEAVDEKNHNNNQ